FGLRAKPVALLSRGAEVCEPLERGVELLLEPVPLCRKLVSLPGMPFLDLGQPPLVLVERGVRLGQSGLQAVLLGGGVVGLLLALRELLVASGFGLGEGRLEAFELRGRLVSLLVLPSELLLALGTRLGEGALEVRRVRV